LSLGQFGSISHGVCAQQQRLLFVRSNARSETHARVPALLHGSTAEGADGVLQLQSCRKSARLFCSSAILLHAPPYHILLTVELGQRLSIQCYDGLRFSRR